MDPLILVSPHLDDAALSAGQLLAGWPGAFVFTLFGGLPAEPCATRYDVNCGFADSTEAIVARGHEDDRAMQVLRARQLRAAFLDNQYRMRAEVPPDAIRIRDDVTAAVARAVVATSATRLFGPLGLLHPDHLIASDATLEVGRTTKIPTWLYEELPSRVLEPVAVGDRLGAIAATGLSPTIEFVGTGDMAVKRTAAACYASQLWALDANVLYVPERFHRVV